MNNFEKIKAMSIEEMAEFISKLYCHSDCDKKWNCDNCIDNFKRWLESESEDAECQK